MRLTFCGGAKSVTGANYLLEVGERRLLVDCGLVQGVNFAEAENAQPFPYDPTLITALVVTHAHADHVGRIPKLVRDGFRRPIYATPPTAELAQLMLEDAQHLLAKEAELAGGPVLYESADVAAVAPLWRAVHYRESFEVVPGITATLRDAGHILGSAIVEFAITEGTSMRRVVFSGDLGNAPDPLLPAPETVEHADIVVMESVYGDRSHEDRQSRKLKLERIAEETIKAGGALMIPVFAVERTQEILFELNELVEHGRIPRVPVFLDAPLAIRATEIYRRSAEYFNERASRLIASGDDIFKFPGLRMTLTKEESKLINDVRPPKIIIAGSGMSQGGRIHHHLIRYLPDPHSTFLSVGYQSPGSIGRRILEGESPIELRGGFVPVRCRIEHIAGYSGHADREALRAWVGAIARPVEKVFAVQGEVRASEALAQRLRDRLGVDAVVPNPGDVFTPLERRDSVGGQAKIADGS